MAVGVVRVVLHWLQVDTGLWCPECCTYQQNRGVVAVTSNGHPIGVLDLTVCEAPHA